jgi:hypothetical protein
MPKIDLPALKENAPSHVLVTIPAECLLGMVHPQIIVSGKIYQPGETYKVKPDEGAWIESRIKGFKDSQIKINRNTQDAKSMREAQMYGTGKQAGSGGFVNPHSPDFN